MSSQHRKQSTSLNFGRHFVIKFSIRFKGEAHLENLCYLHGLVQSGTPKALKRSIPFKNTPLKLNDSGTPPCFMDS